MDHILVQRAAATVASRFLRLLCAAMVCGSMYAGQVQISQAAPVTFQFEATIGTVYPGIPFDSGIDFGLGDVISGRFTFEPAVGDGSMLFFATQPYEFSLDINGIVISTPSFDIRSVNDSPIADFPPASVVDSLEVGGGGWAAADPATLPNIDADQSSFRMSLLGPAGSLQLASHPADIADWNVFDLSRQMVVSFSDGKGGAAGFQATVGQFALFPEPSSLSLSSLLVAFSLLISRQIGLSHRRPRRLECDFSRMNERVIKEID